MANLYKLTQEQLCLYEMLERGDFIDEETGEISPELIEKLEISGEAINEKIKNIGVVIKQFLADAKMLKDEEVVLAARRKKAENAAEHLKRSLENSMLLLGLTKFDDAKVAISFRKSTSVQITDEAALPREYVKETITYSPSKTEISKALKEGKVINGACLVENRNIQIK